MLRTASIAFWTYVTPLMAMRATRIGILFFGLFLAGTLLLGLTGAASHTLMTTSLKAARQFLVMLGLPLGAAIVAEMPIRDGIRHRTLLYPLLGPVDRATMAVVRTLVTALLLGAAVGLLLTVIRILLGDGLGFLPRELAAAFLGALAYTSIFGFIHLLNRRGLVTGLAAFFLLDAPLGRVPFAIRNLSPSYHLGVLADQGEKLALLFPITAPESSVGASALFLLGVAIVFLGATALGFRRQSLGNLC